MAELYRYAAFISYSSKDGAFAKRLHRALEGYTIPKSLGAFDIIGGGKKNRIYPVFRDREELAAGQLGELIEANLRASAALVVVCSPNGAVSPWIQKEIEYFAGLGRADKIFAIISNSAPLLNEDGQDATAQCFPAAFRGDALSGDALEPLAADARKTKDGFQRAWLKIVAGLIGASPGGLIDRDAVRRSQQRLFASIGGALAALAALFISSSVDALQWRGQLAAYARVLASQDRQMPALAFALAAVPDGASILRARNSETDSLLADVGGPGVAMDLGPPTSVVFSNNHRFALTPSPNDGGWRMTYFESGVSMDIGGGGPLQASALLSENGETLLARDEFGHFAVYLVHSEVRKYNIPALESAIVVSMAESGGRVAFMTADGELGYADLDFSGLARVRMFGRSNTNPASFAISADGSLLLTAYRGSRGGSINVYDLRGGGSTWNEFSGISNYLHSPDGNVLIYPANESGQYHYENLTTGDRFDFDVGVSRSEIAFNDISDDGSAKVVFIGDDRNLRALHIDLNAHGERTDLGDVGFMQQYTMSRDGRYLVWWIDGGDAKYFSAADRRVVDLGNVGAPRIGEFILSRQANVLVVRQSTDGRADLYRWPSQVGDPLPGPRSLGHLGRIFAVSDDATVLITQDPGNLNVLAYRLDNAVETGARSGEMRQNICLNANGLRPFAAYLRANESGRLSRAPSEETIHRALVGRPWNACDWRGLLAIVPNEARGDGWFEGVGQWLRLIQIRYLGATDWACEETTSRARDWQIQSRQQMCERESIRNDGVAEQSGGR